MKIYFNSATLIKGKSTALINEKDHYLFHAIIEGHERSPMMELRCDIDDPNLELLLSALKDDQSVELNFSLA